MEAEQLGYIEGTECKFVKTDPALIEKIAQKRKQPVEMIKKTMRYNVFTVAQFCTLTGLEPGTVNNHTRPSILNGVLGAKLDYCHPFPDGTGLGPKFIVRNEKSEKYLK